MHGKEKIIIIIFLVHIEEDKSYRGWTRSNKLAIGDGIEIVGDQKQDDELRYQTERSHYGWSPIVVG